MSNIDTFYRESAKNPKTVIEMHGRSHAIPGYLPEHTCEGAAKLVLGLPVGTDVRVSRSKIVLTLNGRTTDKRVKESFDMAPARVAMVLTGEITVGGTDTVGTPAPAQDDNHNGKVTPKDRMKKQLA